MARREAGPSGPSGPPGDGIPNLRSDTTKVTGLTLTPLEEHPTRTQRSPSVEILSPPPPPTTSRPSHSLIPVTSLVSPEPIDKTEPKPNSSRPKNTASLPLTRLAKTRSTMLNARICPMPKRISRGLIRAVTECSSLTDMPAIRTRLLWTYCKWDKEIHSPDFKCPHRNGAMIQLVLEYISKLGTRTVILGQPRAGLEQRDMPKYLFPCPDNMCRMVFETDVRRTRHMESLHSLGWK